MRADKGLDGLQRQVARRADPQATLVYVQSQPPAGGLAKLIVDHAGTQQDAASAGHRHRRG